MKTFIYLIITILICGFVLTGFTKSTNINSTILIQSVDKNVSSVSLIQSAEIISNRLKALSSGKFDVSVIPKKNQIRVDLGENWDQNAVKNLLTQKGKLEFYATYNHRRISEFLNGDNRLFALLNATGLNDSAEIAGCTTIADRDKIDGYLKSVKLNEKCRFAWSQSASSHEVCLYALQLENQKGTFLTGVDVESAKFNQIKNLKLNVIEIKFKGPAIPLWADFTKRNLNNAIAIVLDDNVVYAPTVRSVIEKGNCSITGDFTEAEIKFMAIIMNYGELPVRFKVVD